MLFRSVIRYRSWQGHVDQFTQKQQHARDLLDEWRGGPCSGSGTLINEQEAFVYSNREAPALPGSLRSSWTLSGELVPNTLSALLSAGGAYVIYRTVRFIFVAFAATPLAPVAAVAP